MRVIAGTARGRPLAAPRGMATRPTADRVKEALFNALGPLVPGATCLDVFAGSGALGIEALSRGAEGAVFLENRPEALRIIRRNLEATGFSSMAEVLDGEALGQLSRMATQGRKFTLVLVDPPYGKGLAAAALAGLDRGLVQPGGMIVVEAGKREGLPETVGRLQRTRTYLYGDTLVVFYKNMAD